MTVTERPTLAEDGWIEEVRAALAAADAHPEHDRAEYAAGYLVNFVCTRETAAEQRGAAARTAEIVACLRELDHREARLHADYIERVWSR